MLFHTQEGYVGIQPVGVNTEVSVETTPFLRGLESNDTAHAQVKVSGIMDEDTKVFYAYLTVGTITLCSALTFFIVFILSPPRKITKTKEEQEKEIKDDVNIKPDNLEFKIPFLVGVFVFFTSFTMVELTYANFLSAYATLGLGWSRTMGAAITTVFWASFTLGRAVGIYLVKQVSPQVFLGISCYLSVISMLPLLLFAHAHYCVLWITSIALGFSMSTMFATAITWTERYVNISGGVGTIFLTAGTAGELVGQLLFSALYKIQGIESFVYIIFSGASISFLLYIVLQTVAHKKGERYIKPSIMDSTKRYGSVHDITVEDSQEVGEKAKGYL